MGLVVEPSELVDLAPGSHVCWVVRDPAGYLECAATLLAQAGRTNEKPVVFGPACGDALEILRPLAAMAADPWEAFLGRGDLNPDAIFTMMEEQTARARDEGYRGIRLVADMDWLIPARPSVELLVGFELLLDRHVKRLGATIICAYRETSFDTEALAGALSVHPVEVGVDSPPQFRLVADDLDRWRLVGEVDIAVDANFRAAIAATVGSPCVIDASSLAFIDVGGMRALAEAVRSSHGAIRLVGAPAIVRRGWQMAGFAEMAPTVELVG